MKSEIVFIGLGNMGLPMALNLCKAGHTVSGYDLIAASMEKFVDGGGIAIEDLAQALGEATVIITMLPASRHVEAAYLGECGIFARAAPQALLIDCSTISPEVARKLAVIAHDKGFNMLDAPVSGGTKGANQASLTFMVGGTLAGFNAAKPYLEKMGKAIFHAGNSGSGQTVKVCNNMLLGIAMVGSCEAIKLGMANGMDPKILSDIMAQSSGRNWVLEVYNPCPGVMPTAPASNGYQAGFGVDLMLKDLNLAIENASLTHIDVALGTLARDLFVMHSKNGAGSKDFSSIFEMQLAENAQELTRQKVSNL